MIKYLYDPDCQRCPLSSTVEKDELICVPGNGLISSGAMILGEAPGRNEALGGEPFVGQAGQLLNSTLDKFGWRREHLFVSNVVKCRPPGNRNPAPGEESACKIFLEREITVVKPAVIMTLGNHALRALLGEWGVTRFAGRWQSLESKNHLIDVLPNYHPAYILRNRSMLPQFEANVKAFCERLTL